MNRHWHHRRFITLARSARHALQSTNHTFHNRIDHFEVRRVRHQTKPDVATVHRTRAHIAHVVLHVAGGVFIRVIVAPFELRKQRFEWLAHHVGQHVQPTAMCHPDHHFARPGATAFIDHRIEHGDQCVRAFHTEAFVPDIRAPEKTLEPIHLVEPMQDGTLFVDGEITCQHASAKRLPKPLAFGVDFDVPHLVADVARVDRTLALNQLERGGKPIVAERRARNRPKVVVSQTVELGGQFVRARRRCAKRIELHRIVAVVPNRLLQRGGPSHLLEQVEIGGRRTGGGRRRRRCIVASGARGRKKRLGNAEILAPGLVHTGWIATITLELFNDDAIVEDAGNGRRAHSRGNLTARLHMAYWASPTRQLGAEYR